MTNEQQSLEPRSPVVLQQPPAKPTDEIDLGPVFSYLQSPQGHEIVSRVIQMMEDVKKSTLDKGHTQARFNRTVELVVIVVVLSGIVVLSVFDKMNPTAGVALGSLVGYFFGKSKS